MIPFPFLLTSFAGGVADAATSDRVTFRAKIANKVHSALIFVVFQIRSNVSSKIIQLPILLFSGAADNFACFQTQPSHCMFVTFCGFSCQLRFRQKYHLDPNFADFHSGRDFVENVISTHIFQVSGVFQRAPGGDMARKENGKREKKIRKTAKFEKNAKLDVD